MNVRSQRFRPQQTVVELGFVKQLIDFFSMAINLTFKKKINKKKLSDFLSTLYIFACKRMLPGTVLEVNEHREAGEEAGASSGAEPRAGL